MGWSAVGLMGLICVCWVDLFDRFCLLGRSVWSVTFARFDRLIVWWVWFFFFSHGFDSYGFGFTVLMGLMGIKNMNSHVLGRTWRTRMHLNILVVQLIGVVLVVVHTVVRKTDDLFLDEEAFGYMPSLIEIVHALKEN